MQVFRKDRRFVIRVVAEREGEVDLEITRLEDLHKGDRFRLYDADSGEAASGSAPRYMLAMSDPYKNADGIWTVDVDWTKPPAPALAG